ncbi:MAG: hypothetical protein AVDCRST_MAG12-2585, partial [uncultured Rubrobacteraceae bacterium]
ERGPAWDLRAHRGPGEGPRQASRGLAAAGAVRGGAGGAAGRAEWVRGHPQRHQHDQRPAGERREPARQLARRVARRGQQARPRLPRPGPAAAEGEGRLLPARPGRGHQKRGVVARYGEDGGEM